MQIPLTPALADLVRWIARCRDADDPAAARGLRVATRKIDVWLRLGGRRVLRDDLRWLRAAAGPARDLDVLLDARGITGVHRDALRHRRDRANADVVATLATPRAAGLVQALVVLPPIARSDARPQLQRLARDAVTLPDDTAVALHAVRRAVRRVRYGLEWLGEPDEPLVEAQDALGAISDRLMAGEPDLDADDPLVATGRAAWHRARTFLETWE